MRRILVILVVAVVLETATNAGIVPLLDLVQLTRDSSLIVIGQIGSLNQERRGNFDVRGQTMPGRLMVGDLQVNRVIKGQAMRRIVFRFVLPDQFAGYRGIPTNQIGMFFFKQTKDGIVFTSPFHPYVNAIREGDVAKGDEINRVMVEISRVIFSSSVGAFHRAISLSYLERMRTNRSGAILKRASQELAYPLNALAASYLLRRNDISALSLVEKSLKESPALVIQDAVSGFDHRFGHVATI